MTSGGQEIEAKFYVNHLDRIKARLEELGGRLVQERVLESNIRFDLPGARLRDQGRVLRLRHDTEARLTYKSAGENHEGAVQREEIEFVVEDFEKARRFLEALGYEKLFYYEKYRTTYEIEGSLLMLDELPYGEFIEIEGQTHEAIRGLARQLNLKWDAAIATSYHALFERVCASLNKELKELSFAEFAGRQVNAEVLRVQAADL